MIKKLILFLTLVAGISLSPRAQDIPEPMKPRRVVNDFTGLFSKQEQATLERKLRDFNDSTSTQIAVVTLSTLDGYDINDYAARLGEKWGVGQKGKDNGIVLLIKPKNKREPGQVAISVGYGLEGVIPDVIASRLIRDEIIPAFRQGNYYKGVDKALTVLTALSKGEYTTDEYKKKNESSGVFDVITGTIIFAVLLSLIFRRRGGGGYSPGHTSGGGFFIFPMGGFGGGSNSGGFGGFSSGGGSFGGFGGGSFGGGGSSGSW